MIAKSTAIPFVIAASSPTSESSVISKPAKRSSYFAVGSVIFLLGSVPAAGEISAPSAVRPPLMSFEVSEEGRSFEAPDAIERGISRLQAFSSYPDDWDGQGASAANGSAVDNAIRFLTLLEVWHPIPLATLSRAGDPILEFDDVDTGMFSSIAFLPEGVVELYAKRKDADHSDFLSGSLSSDEVNSFLLDVMNLPTI